jgi:fatty acyl-CoA reductase
MKKEQPKYSEKISAVIGDCNMPNMGIGEQYMEILKNEVCNNSYNNLLK